MCGYDLGFAPRLAVYPCASQFTSFWLFPLLKKMLWNLSTSPRCCEDIRVKFCTHADFSPHDNGCKVLSYRIIEFCVEDQAYSIVLCVGYSVVLLLM